MPTSNEGGARGTTKDAGSKKPTELTVADLAKQVLGNSNIDFVVAAARSSVEAAANGQPSAVEVLGTTTMLSAQLLQVMLIMAQKHSIGIGYVTNGSHSSGSAHYDGRAMDIDTIDGAATQGRDSNALALIRDSCAQLPDGIAFGQSNCGPAAPCSKATVFSDSCNHLHVQVAQKTGTAGGVSGGGSTGGTTAGGGIGQVTTSDLFAIGRASAISTQMQLPGILNFAESIWMKGAKSIYNDEPLMPFVEQLCKASLRQFQSLPNGAFFAFFPDQFGLYGHRKPYWNIDNIEIIDGGIELNDESLATHVFVVGDTVNYDGAVDLTEKVASKGVITIFDAFASDFMISGRSPHKNKNKADGESAGNLKDHAEALSFLQKYGIRPHYEEAPFIRNSFFEIFYAFTQFQILWSNQFRTSFQFTFMPELYPGGIVAFEDHGIQCYIDSVTHSFDYESGFTTQANLSAPAALGGQSSPISRGMVRPYVGFSDNANDSN